VDNVQWADLAATQALRSMPRLLASYPMSWILAMGTSSDAGPAELLFGAARTRRRLRRLGVRRRHWASEQRPAAGWASLTDIEQATARLVAEGLTNQRIADQLFSSTHTVAFHLRQVFCKLDIRSRVDLARIALEDARPEAAQTPRLGDVRRPAWRRG
jgi:DNA-binding CsgD family transcriptional regulator